jgi:hypothetical protein
MANFYAAYPGVLSGGSNPSVAVNGATVAPSSTLVAGDAPGSIQQPISVDSSGNQNVNVVNTAPVSGTVTANQGTANTTANAWPVELVGSGNVASVTAANAVKVDGSAVTQPISAASLPLPTGAATNSELVTINSTLGSPFQAGGSIGNTAFGATQSGAWSVTANAGTNLNTSALATSANQTNASQKTQIVDGSGNVIASTSNALNVDVVNTIATSSPVNSNGSSSTTTVSTVATITKPSNAVAFILQNDVASTDYIRWCDSNSTASTSSGGLFYSPAKTLDSLTCLIICLFVRTAEHRPIIFSGY